MNKENEVFNLPDPVCKAHQNKKVKKILFYRQNIK